MFSACQVKHYQAVLPSFSFHCLQIIWLLAIRLQTYLFFSEAHKCKHFTLITCLRLSWEERKHHREDSWHFITHLHTSWCLSPVSLSSFLFPEENKKRTVPWIPFFLTSNLICLVGYSLSLYWIIPVSMQNSTRIVIIIIVTNMNCFDPRTPTVTLLFLFCRLLKWNFSKELSGLYLLLLSNNWLTHCHLLLPLKCPWCGFPHLPLISQYVTFASVFSPTDLCAGITFSQPSLQLVFFSSLNLLFLWCLSETEQDPGVGDAVGSPSGYRFFPWSLFLVYRKFPSGSVVKNPPGSVGDTGSQVWSLSQEDPLEKEVATRSSILAWGIPWTEEPGRVQFMGSQRVGHDLATKQQQPPRPSLSSKGQIQTFANQEREGMQKQKEEHVESEKFISRTYLQNRNRLIDIGNKLIASKGDGFGGDNLVIWD